MKFLSVSVFVTVVVALVSAQENATTTAAPSTAPTTAAPTTQAATTQAATTQMTTQLVTNMTSGATTEMTTEPVTTNATTAMPPTTPMPEKDWILKDNDGNVCMNMSFIATFEIKYEMTDGKSNTSVKVPLPEMSANTTGSVCSNSTPIFVLNWNTWKMEMVFELNEKDTDDDVQDYSLKNYTLTYTLDDTKYFPKAKDPSKVRAANTSSNSIEADVGNYYKCDSKTNIKAENTTTTFTEMKLHPFALSEPKNNTNYNECVADSEISNIVPIAVGCALAGLVIIVLIAYLIGRSRSNRQGYQSV